MFFEQHLNFKWQAAFDGLFFGKVVDMLHFPIWNGQFPNWVPSIGGEAFLFFEPVFNIADVAISSGIGVLLLFNKKTLKG